MFVVGLQMVLDTGWQHLVKELFPLSNISSYHIFMSSKGYSTEVGTSAEYGGMSVTKRYNWNTNKVYHQKQHFNVIQ